MLEGKLSKLMRIFRPDGTAMTLHDVGLVLTAAAILGTLGYSVFEYGPRLGTMVTNDTVPIETATIKLVEAPRAAERPTAAPAAKPAQTLMRDVVPESSFAIVRKLQSRLKRAGCYRGQVNGAWTSKSRRAMQSFTKAVNATLPVDQPDAVLLALIDANPDIRCGGSEGRVEARANTQSPKAQSGATTQKAAAQSDNQNESDEPERAAAASPGSVTGTSADGTRPFPRPTLIPVAPSGEPSTAETPETAEAPETPKRRTAKRRSRASRSTKSPSNLAESLLRDVQKAFKSAF